MLLPWPAVAAAIVPVEIPEVHFAVFRLDLESYDFEAAYEFSQPFRKSLLYSGRRHGNVYVRIEPAHDSGYTEITSRLTGQLILHAGTVWNGIGRFRFPTDSLLLSTVEYGLDNPQPDSVEVLNTSGYWEDDWRPDEAWARVQDTDVIHRLAAHGGYELVVLLHFYTVGGLDPTTAEWILIAHTNPPAPDEVAIIDMPWPRALIMRDQPVVPELVVHNFGDGPMETAVRLEVDDGYHVVYEEILDLEAIPEDSTVAAAFGPIDNMGLSSMLLRYVLIQPSGGPWNDAYPDTDVWENAIEVTDFPVFRQDPTIPRGGWPVDFDDDGDWDIIGLRGTFTLWQNDGTGAFTDITDRSDFPTRRHYRRAVCEDFDGDALLDLLLITYQESLQLLQGDGTGAFTDASVESGVSDVEGLWDAEATDIDGDNDADLIIQTKKMNRVLENDGTGHFSDITSVSGLWDTSQTEDVEVGDLNGDRFPEVVLTNWNAPTVVYVNDGTGRFRLLERSWGITNGRGARLFDYDGDGLTDILFRLTGPHGPCKIFRNLGNLTFTDASHELDLPDAFDVDTYDLNNDGLDEIIFSEGTLFVSHDGRYQKIPELIIGLERYYLRLPRVRWADMDNDGYVDIYSEQGFFKNQTVRPIEPPNDEEPNPGRRAFSLQESFPIPFRPNSAIVYELHAGGRVRLTIHDVLGRRVRTLVDEVQLSRAAVYTATWDGRTNSGERAVSGVYLYRLSVAGTTETGRTVLVR
jgi:hypothetical protein